MTNRQLLEAVEFMFAITEAIFNGEEMVLDSGTDLREAMKEFERMLGPGGYLEEEEE